MRESRGASAVIRCGAGLHGAAGPMATIEAGHGVGGHILQGATKPALAAVEDEGAFSENERAFLGAEHVTGAMVVPLVNPGVSPGELRVDGLVYAARRDGAAFGPESVSLATRTGRPGGVRRPLRPAAPGGDAAMGPAARGRRRPRRRRWPPGAARQGDRRRCPRHPPGRHRDGLPARPRSGRAALARHRRPAGRAGRS